MTLEVNTTCVHSAHVLPTPGLVPAREPEPLRYTYNKLFAEFSAELQDVRFDRYCLNEWLAFNGVGLDEIVGVEMTAKFAETISNFSSSLAKRLSDKTIRNIRARIRSLKAVYDEALEKEAVPLGFREALDFGMARLGLTPGDLLREIGMPAYKWACGLASPDPRHKKRSGTSMEQLEKLLRFPPGVLAERAWPSAAPIMTLADDLPYRRYVALSQSIPYAAKFETCSDQLQSALAAYYEHKREQTHLLSSGEIVTLGLTEVWSSASTRTQVAGMFSFYFGFLCLPKAEGRRPWPELLKFGGGLRPEDLRFTMLCQKELLFQYMLYSEQRSFDRAHFEHYEAQQKARAEGRPAPVANGVALRKSVPSSYLRFLNLCLNLVNKPTGFLRMHPEFGQELPVPVPADQWEAWCLSRHAELLALYKAAESKVEYNKRSNKEVLAEVLSQDDPRGVFIQLVERMKLDMPMDTAPLWQARQWRDLTLIALLTFECLRAKNVWMLDIGRHITLKDGKYHLFIPKEEMKNFIHGHAQDIRRVFPEDLQDVLHRWITIYRPRLEGHDKTNALFLRIATGPKPKNKDDFYRMDSNRVGEAIAKATKKYLGRAVRTHGFRNVNATSVVKLGGTIHQLKATLNDSEKTASNVYLAINNADQVEKLVDIYNQSRARVIG